MQFRVLETTGPNLSKKGQKYLIVAGFLVTPRGSRMGKLFLMERPDNPLPTLKSGVLYDLVVECYVAKDMNVAFAVRGLEEAKAAKAA